jgi:hypothetical protein
MWQHAQKANKSVYTGTGVTLRRASSGLACVYSVFDQTPITERRLTPISKKYGLPTEQ